MVNINESHTLLIGGKTSEYNATKGPFIYYVSIGLGGWVQKMAIFAYVQYINDAYIVGGWV